MTEKEFLQKKLREYNNKRRILQAEKKELLRQISYTKALLIQPENQNSFYKNKLKTLNDNLLKNKNNIDLNFEICRLLFSKLRIVKLNLKEDNYLETIAVKDKNLSTAIENINCYGCIESGEIFDGPSNLHLNIPSSTLETFEKASKVYKKNLNN